MRRRPTFTRGLALALGYALGITLAACSGGRSDPTAPDPGLPIPDPAPIPAPEPMPDPVYCPAVRTPVHRLR